MADEELFNDIAEHVRSAHAQGCAAAVQVIAGADEHGPALVRLVGPDPVCVSFTTTGGQANAMVTDEDWAWLVAHGGEPGGARADATLDGGGPDVSAIKVTVAPQTEAGGHTLTIGTVVLRLPAGEWEHLLANRGAYARDDS